MPVHVDETLPLHPLSVADVIGMVDAGILDADDHVELLDGVLVEMSPQGTPHGHAVRRLTALAAPVVAAAGLELSVQGPVDIGSPISLPEPDLAIVPVTGPDALPRNPLLVVEMGVTSLRIDLVRKARIYATGNVPEYWVLDVERRSLIVHRTPQDGAYAGVRTLEEHETVTAVALDLTVPVAALL
jgi:Uma2 family endonuclease